MSGLLHGIGDLGHALGDVGHALGDVGHVVGDHIPLVDHGHGIRLHYVQARDPDYEKAAAELILQLNAAEVQQGQLVSIDVHSNGLDQPAQFVAFFCPSLPRLGAPDGTGLKLAFESQLHQSYDWTEFYSRSHATAEAVAPHHKCDPGVRRGQLVAMTGHVSKSLEKALKDKQLIGSKVTFFIDAYYTEKKGLRGTALGMTFAEEEEGTSASPEETGTT